MSRKKERILVIGPVPPPYNGGIASFIGSMRESSFLAEKFDLIYQDVTLSWPPVKYTPVRAILSLKFFYSLLSRLVFNRPRLVHIHCASYLSFAEKAVMMFVCRLFGRKAIIHIHGNSFRLFYQQTLFKPLIRFALNRANAVIAVSGYWKNYLESICKTPVFALYNCADKIFFNTVKEDSLKRQSILFVGKYVREKGLFDLLDALRSLRIDNIENSLVLVGYEGKQNGLREIRQYITEKEIAGVELIKDASPEQIIELLESAAVFVLPSYNEGLPIAILEAMAAGVPVVATPVGGIPEIIEDGKNGFLIPAGDSTALAEKIKILLENNEMRTRMGAVNRKIAFEKYSPERCMKTIAGIYDNSIGTGN